MPVHVSIHDVSPAWSPEVETALALCHAAGVKPALLVVPNFHRTAPLERDAKFCARLRALQADGHEVYLHGFFHQSAERYTGSSGGGRLRWLVAQRVVSGGEAEMSDVSEPVGRARVEEGERVLQRAGLAIDGFVAPAWSMPSWLLPVLAARGYRFTEDHTRIYDPLGGRSRASVVMNWATRSPGRLLSTVAYCRAAANVAQWARAARAFLPARLAIHPADMRFRLVRGEVERFLGWAKGDVIAQAASLFA
jgi:predicted deacetylase